MNEYLQIFVNWFDDASLFGEFVCQPCGASYGEVAHLNKHLVRQHSARDDPGSLMAHSIYPKDLRCVR